MLFFLMSIGGTQQFYGGGGGGTGMWLMGFIVCFLVLAGVAFGGATALLLLAGCVDG